MGDSAASPEGFRGEPPRDSAASPEGLRGRALTDSAAMRLKASERTGYAWASASRKKGVALL